MVAAFFTAMPSPPPYGGAGALVQLSTRSGTNSLHGTAFEFLRNTDLAARNYFALTLPPYHQNQFGGTVGGPIKKNRTFFFFSAQDTQRRSAPSPVSITTPTAAERTGDFSALLPKVITNPSGVAFPGNIIPASLLDPVSVKVANALLPLPNSGTQWVGQENQNLDDTQYPTSLQVLLRGVAIDKAFNRWNLQQELARGKSTAEIASVGDAELYRQLSFIYARLNKNKDALGAAAHARVLAPTNPGTYRQMASVLFAEGRPQEAAVALMEGLLFADDNSVLALLGALYRGGLDREGCAVARQADVFLHCV